MGLFHLTKKGPHTVTPFITGCLGLPAVQDCQVMQAVTFLAFEKWPSTKFAD